ncbi:hypothetical protein GPALN_010372 [Globodera pallida]|nr:hypothetical protein GPALN_010372 [Globodera pallida]
MFCQSENSAAIQQTQVKVAVRGGFEPDVSTIQETAPQLDRHKWKSLALRGCVEPNGNFFGQLCTGKFSHSGCFCCVNQSPNGRHLLLHLPPDITSDGLWKTKSGTPNLEANTGDQED